MFKVDWVLINEICIGPAPKKNKHLRILKELKVSSILSLCDRSESNLPDGQINDFKCHRIVLPDHTSGRNPTPEELILAVNKLSILKSNGSVFVHCLAGVERSPLVCMAWLIKNKSFSTDSALEYMMQVHPRTNPLPGQIKVLSDLIS